MKLNDQLDLMLQPSFIPLFPEVQMKHNLNDSELIVYGLFSLYGNYSHSFLQTRTSDIASLLNRSALTIRRSIKTLKEKKLL